MVAKNHYETDKEKLLREEQERERIEEQYRYLEDEYEELERKELKVRF